ncbi:MAG: hypothetical protein U0325_15330 [Polyangiales bacterium]
MRSRVLLSSVLVSLGCASEREPAPAVDAATAAVDVAAVDAPAPAADVEEAIFDPGPPREVHPGATAAGMRCEADDACVHGVCARGEGLVPACAWRCQHDADCAGLGERYRCVLERAGGTARLVCAQTAATSGETLDPCVADTDCRGRRCMNGACAGACASDDDCPPGLRCGNVEVDGARLGLCRPAPISGVTVERYTIVNDDVRVGERTAEHGVYVPGDAVSATWTTHDLEGADLYAAVASLRAPQGELVVNLSTWSPIFAQPLRTSPARFQFNAAMVAANDGVTLEPGVWRSAHVITDFRSGMTVTTTRRMSAAFILKRAPAGTAAAGWTLRLRLVFVGTRDINAASAPTNTRLRTAVETMQRIYGTAGVRVQVVGYEDLTGDDAGRLSLIDDRGELQELFYRPAPGDDVLTVYLVRGVAAGADFENAIGVAGAILGPPGVDNTVQSGVMVGWETTLSNRRDQLGFTMAHECGHYLGLSHTRERLDGCTTTMTTNCAPWGGVDAIDDTPNSNTLAARYLMYYLAVGGNELISPTQGLVLRRNPLVH